MGQVIDGRFEIEGALGEGGAGSVLRARDLSVDRPVALKLLKDAKNPVRVERFRREGAITAGLTHPGIVKVHATGVVDGHPYLVYELVEGAQTLREAARTLTREAAVALMIDVAEAVGYAHAQTIVHRDLKPDNILLDAEGRPRVADFGIALREDLDRLTLTGGFVGTPQYMAPEQLDGRGDGVGPATDVWALGVILYELVCGALPFQGDSLQALFQAISEGRLRRPSVVDPTIPSWLSGVVRRALSVDPADRYPDASAFAAALRRRDRAGVRLGALTYWLGAALLVPLVGVALASRWSAPTSPGSRSPTPTPVASTPTPAPVDPVEALRRGFAAGPGVERLKAWLGRPTGSTPELNRLTSQYRQQPLRVFPGSRLGRWVDDRRVVLGGDAEVALVDLQKAAPLRLWKSQVVNALELDPARERCFVGDVEGGVFVLGLGKDQAPLQTVFRVPSSSEHRDTSLHPSHIRSVALSPDGRWLAVAGNFFAVFVLDAGTFAVRKRFKSPSTQHAVRWSPQGRYLAYTQHAARQGRLVVLEAGSYRMVLERAVVTPTAIAFTPDDSEVVVGDLTGAMTIFSLPGGAGAGLYRGELGSEVPRSIRRQGFAHQGMIHSIEHGRPGELWSLCKGSQIRDYERHELRCWSVADRRERRPVWRFRLPPGPRGTRDLAIDPTRRLALIGVGPTTPQVEVWALD